MEKQWAEKRDENGNFPACIDCGNELHVSTNPYTNRYSLDCLECGFKANLVDNQIEKIELFLNA